ncbi:MAG TPA: hypothetical protein VNU01_02480, partial [Egibacteraceae bacterium]|nr:hypothetical protein [Egibacteraceae bacterium]
MRIARVIAVLVAVVLSLSGLGAAPAAAHHDFSCAFHDETEFKNLPPGCRNFLIDPGVGNSLTRAKLMAHPELYAKQGINEQFLWHARETVRHVGKDETVSWNRCAYVPGAGNACDPGSVLSSITTIGRQFGGAVTLTVLEHAGMFIGLACGNVRDDVPPPEMPTPGIAGSKFLDRDRDGGWDGDEPGLGGWRIDLHLVESFVGGFAPGKVRETTTASDGGYLFRLDGLPPGRYRVTEESRPGWAQTRQPADVTVPFGIGNDVVKGNDFGNVETRADVVKASFELIDPPLELRADQPTELLVRATLRNDGPADIVDVTDTLTVGGLEDCAILPRRQTVTRRLVEGQVVVVDLAVTVTCGDPSFHPFDFANDLAVATPGVTDPDPGDNHREFTHTIPVIDLADISVDEVVLD